MNPFLFIRIGEKPFAIPLFQVKAIRNIHPCEFQKKDNGKYVLFPKDIPELSRGIDVLDIPGILDTDAAKREKIILVTVDEDENKSRMPAHRATEKAPDASDFPLQDNSMPVDPEKTYAFLVTRVEEVEHAEEENILPLPGVFGKTACSCFPEVVKKNQELIPVISPGHLAFVPEKRLRETSHAAEPEIRYSRNSSLPFLELSSPRKHEAIFLAENAQYAGGKQKIKMLEPIVEKAVEELMDDKAFSRRIENHISLVLTKVILEKFAELKNTFTKKQ